MKDYLIMGQMAADTILTPPPPVLIGAHADILPAVSAPSGLALTSRIVTTSIARDNLSIAMVQLGAIVTDAARQTLDHPNPPADQDSAGWTYTADGALVPTADLAEAVITAHEQRVAVLRSRMTALCAAGAAAPTLATLYDRLQRAEAARWLALARTGRGERGRDQPTVGDTACPNSSEGTGERHRNATLATQTPQIVHRWARVQTTGGQEKWGSVSLRYIASETSPLRTRKSAPMVGAYTGRYQELLRVAVTQRLLVQAITVGYARNSRRIRHAIDPGTAARLVRVRRSLAAARRALGNGREVLASVSTPVSATPPTVALPGLWRWNGSDKWSLMPSNATIG